ncbi:MAG: TlpA family protein disulfide reductase [Desulfovibrio sp.]|jgi:thiol-disulfide isomerase/thioredoxin|nr:TlpA family protein disulfide reductase [Desulfovibrio sp.]
MSFFARKRAFPVLALLLWLSLAAAYARAAEVEKLDASGLIKFVVANRGKVVAVNIFASWCPPCRVEIPGLINIRNNFSRDDVVLLGVSVDKERKALDTYIEEMHINYPVALGVGDFTQRVGVNAVPHLLVYDREGELKVNHKGLVETDDLERILRDMLAR